MLSLFLRSMWQPPSSAQLKADLLSGITVFLVALPLCLGIALASGAPLVSGLLAGMVGGLIVPMVSRSALSVSGPAAGLTALVAAAIALLQDFSLFLAALVLAGLIQMLIGFLRLGTLARYMPSAVIKGMLAGIGLILMIKQLPVAMGHIQADFWDDMSLHLIFQSEGHHVLIDLFQGIVPSAALITGLSFLVYFYIHHFNKYRKRPLPGPLFMVMAGLYLQQTLVWILPEAALPGEQLIQLPDHLFSGFQVPKWEAILSDKRLWEYGLYIALIASIETLLCVEAIDKIDPQNRVTPLNRELVAQGAGNLACGLIGAIPITAVVVRGVVNVEAGAKSGWSSVFHGILLLVSVAFFPWFLELIPYASLAAILLIIGYQLSKPSLFVQQWRLGPAQFIPFVTTVLAILLTDLLIGIGLGLLVSIYFILQSSLKPQFVVEKKKVEELTEVFIYFDQTISFLNKVKLSSVLEAVPSYSIVHFVGRKDGIIDYDILEMISEFIHRAPLKHIEITMKHVPKVEIISHH
jgi:MFS superfamily sulfate permease-like transporter